MIDAVSWFWYRIVGWTDQSRCRCGHGAQLHEHMDDNRSACAGVGCRCRRFRARRERLST